MRYHTLKLVILKKLKISKFDLSFDEIVPPGVPLSAGAQNSSHFSILGVFWTKMFFFSTFDLENDGQGHIFSRSQYQNRVVAGETLKSLSSHTFRSDVWFEL
jgi:hypothetical protein